MAFNIFQRLRIDPYLLVLIGVVGVASVLPAQGAAVRPFGWATNAAVALLFFLQGAKLSREAVVSGLSAGKLHLLVVACTYLLFPIAALALNATGILPPNLRPGLLYLACLPSTVQSSIAFISIARGNIAAAVCAASLSNLLAVVLTPFLVALLLGGHGVGVSWAMIKPILLQLLAPFAVGQLARPLIGAWAARRRVMLSFVDRGSILLVVYTAFSHAVVAGLWHDISGLDIVRLIAAACVLLMVIMIVAALAARALKLAGPEAIVAVICGSQKSLSSGAPMAGLLFAPATAGLMILPLMVFHQVQLFATSILVQRLNARRPPPEPPLARPAPMPQREA